MYYCRLQMREFNVLALEKGAHHRLLKHPIHAGVVYLVVTTASL
jgi:hypothetical protein